MAKGTYERSLINKACKKLGHRYQSPSDLIAMAYLKPFMKSKLRVGKKARRTQLAAAAKIVLEMDTPNTKQAPCAPAHKKPAIKTGSRNKKSNKFYSSWEWKRLRLEAIKLHGQRCQCCGWRPGDTDHGYLVVDHIKPRSKYPALSLDLSNLRVLCNDCNMGKSNVYEDDFRGVDSWPSQIGREE